MRLEIRLTAEVTFEAEAVYVLIWTKLKTETHQIK